MFQEVKIKLAFTFTLIVAGLQFLFSFGFLLHQMFYYGVVMNRLFEFAVVLSIEIILISTVTFIIGYFFVKETMKPAEDMFERLDQFTIDASHELKTPLGVANSSLDLALKTRQYTKYIGETKTYIKQASNLVEKMLELARLDQISMTVSNVPISKTIQRIVHGFRGELEKKNIKVVITIAPERTVKADLILFERCVSNIIENAIKYNRPKGTITIVLVKNQLSLQNTGCKIAADDLPRIFDRFYQTELSRSAKGHGIGLALVKKICDIHGWKNSSRKLRTIHNVHNLTSLLRLS